MTAILLALILLASPARAETYCDGILTSNNVCIGSEGNVPPVIVRCNYYDSGSNSDPRCIGIGDRRPAVERHPSKSTHRRVSPD
jgi:hypothetical protein